MLLPVTSPLLCVEVFAFQPNDGYLTCVPYRHLAPPLGMVLWTSALLLTFSMHACPGEPSMALKVAQRGWDASTLCRLYFVTDWKSVCLWHIQKKQEACEVQRKLQAVEAERDALLEDLVAKEDQLLQQDGRLTMLGQALKQAESQIESNRRGAPQAGDSDAGA